MTSDRYDAGIREHHCASKPQSAADVFPLTPIFNGPAVFWLHRARACVCRSTETTQKEEKVDEPANAKR